MKKSKIIIIIISIILLISIIIGGIIWYNVYNDNRKEKLLSSVKNDFTDNVEAIQCGEIESDNIIASDIHNETSTSNVQKFKEYTIKGNFKDIKGKYIYYMEGNKLQYSKFTYNFYEIIPDNFEKEGQSAYLDLTDEQIAEALEKADKNLEKFLSVKKDKEKWYITRSNEKNVIPSLPSASEMYKSFMEDPTITCYEGNCMIENKNYHISIVFMGIGAMRLDILPL